MARVSQATSYSLSFMGKESQVQSLRDLPEKFPRKCFEQLVMLFPLCLGLESPESRKEPQRKGVRGKGNDVETGE